MLMARSIFLFSTFLTAVCVPHFDLLMGLTGSLTGALLSFIFPCIFHINIKKLKLEYYQVFFDIVILLMGTVCSVTGVYRSGKIRKKLLQLSDCFVCTWGNPVTGDGCCDRFGDSLSWRSIWDVSDRFFTLKKSPTYRFCHQHLKTATIIKSPT